MSTEQGAQVFGHQESIIKKDTLANLERSHILDSIIQSNDEPNRAKRIPLRQAGLDTCQLPGNGGPESQPSVLILPEMRGQRQNALWPTVQTQLAKDHRKVERHGNIPSVKAIQHPSNRVRNVPPGDTAVAVRGGGALKPIFDLRPLNHTVHGKPLPGLPPSVQQRMENLKDGKREIAGGKQRPRPSIDPCLGLHHEAALQVTS